MLCEIQRQKNELGGAQEWRRKIRAGRAGKHRRVSGIISTELTESGEEEGQV